MALPPEFDQPAGYGIRRLDQAIDRGQASVFRWMWFMVPPSSIARNPSFQALLASRFLSDLALQALLFGVLIASARGGGSAFEAAMIGVAFLVPGVALGLFGGAVADALPKRFALGVAYLTMGVLCLSLPLWLDFELRGMLVVLFAVRVLHQVSQPAEASAVPMVATHEELASANSFLSLMSSGGEVVGKALLAPLIVTAFGIKPVVVVAGLLFMLSATRVIAFRVGHHAIDEPDLLGPMGEVIEVAPEPDEDDGHPRMTSTRDALRWLINEPAAFWMLAMAAMASTTNVVLGVLGPQYVRDVLNVMPEKTFYVFAPASLGLIAALILAPILIRIFRERIVAAVGFLLVALGLSLLGTIDIVVGRFADSVLIIGIPGVGERVEMAAVISTLLGLGMTLAAAATQTYIGKYVPSEVHGRIFALLGAMKDGLSIPVLLSMGAVAGWIGVDNVLLISPIVLLVTAFALNGWLGRWRTRPAADGDELDQA
jgi:MFS family permease